MTTKNILNSETEIKFQGGFVPPKHLDTHRQIEYKAPLKLFSCNPFNALYQDELLVNNCPEIKELDEYARNLEDKIEGDFDLDYIVFEFRYNQLAYIRSGLLLGKVKFLKLHKSYGDGTFASFCRARLGITRWQVNELIKAARVAMELIYAGFSILPKNVSQAMAIACFTGDELIESWRKVTENIAPDKITHKSIKSLLFPPTEKDLPSASLKIPPQLHESIHREAAEQGMSIPELLWMMLKFFISGGREPENEQKSHLLKSNNNTEDYAEKERIWRQDLAKLAQKEPNYDPIPRPFRTKTSQN